MRPMSTRCNGVLCCIRVVICNPKVVATLEKHQDVYNIDNVQNPSKICVRSRKSLASAPSPRRKPYLSNDCFFSADPLIFASSVMTAHTMLQRPPKWTTGFKLFLERVYDGNDVRNNSQQQIWMIGAITTVFLLWWNTKAECITVCLLRWKFCKNTHSHSHTTETLVVQNSRQNQ